jgi:DNA helicase-2/ATP-dependent DNA helicase PcrA
LNFEHSWPNAKVFFLEQNYRSTKNIVDASSAMIAPNVYRTAKNLFTEEEPGTPVTIIRFSDSFQEATWITDEIQARIARGVPAAEIAVLFRTNVQSRAFEDLFLERGLAYQLIGGFTFYRRREVQDILSLLRVLANSSDITALERIINIPPRGIGSAAITQLTGAGWNLDAVGIPAIQTFSTLVAELRTYASTHPISQIVRTVVGRINYRSYLHPDTDEGRERWENVEELIGASASFDADPDGLAHFLDAVQLVQDTDRLDRSANRVTLMTLHAAKGLEFETIFISGLEEGLLPHERSRANAEELEEERRLFYVGMTRAKRELFLTLAEERSLRGSVTHRQPSRFLRDIPESNALFVDQTGRGIKNAAGHSGREWDERDDSESVVINLL